VKTAEKKNNNLRY